MLKLQWKQNTAEMTVFLPSGDNLIIPVSCVVRNLTNQWRGRDEVVRTMPDPGHPYNPNIFPVGEWLIGEPIKKRDRYKAPYFIPTNAWCRVHVWELDGEGNYDHKTHQTVIDAAYGLHFSESNTTLGCIKIEKKTDLLWLVNLIKAELALGETCSLSVIGG